MKLLFDVVPIILFFLTYKFYGIFIATGVAIAASVLQVLGYWIKMRRIETMHVLVLFIILILGGATLFFHNELFIKWKPTVVNWAFALAFLLSQFIGKKPLIRRTMESHVDLPPHVWTKLNISWITFFTLIGFANIYVAYHFSTNTWVNFKLFGVLGLTVVFVILQAIYMTRHMEMPETEKTTTTT